MDAASKADWFAGNQVADGGEGRDAVGGEVEGAPLRDRIHERDELDELGLSGFELAIDAKVIAPEGARAHNCDAKREHGYFCAGAPGRGDSTATRQRV